MRALAEAPHELRLRALRGIGAVSPGDDLAALLSRAAREAGIRLSGGVLVVCQKVVSKAEGRLVTLSSVTPSDAARRFAKEDGKDPRHVEVILRETARIVRRGPGARHRRGLGDHARARRRGRGRLRPGAQG